MSNGLDTKNLDIKLDESFDEQALLNDELVCTYLQNDKGFFTRNPQLLASLKFSDSNRGTVSLVERQQQIQRQKIHSLEEEITQLMTVANYNEKLFAVYNDLYLSLIDCDDLPSSFDCIFQTTTQLLNLADCKIYLNPDVVSTELLQSLDHPMLAEEDCQTILAKRLEHSDFYFGRLQQAEKAQIFGDQDVGSVVLIKLHNRQECVGFIAINAIDPEHFQPSMNVLLLSQFRDVVGKLLVKQLSK